MGWFQEPWHSGVYVPLMIVVIWSLEAPIIITQLSKLMQGMIWYEHNDSERSNFSDDLAPGSLHYSFAPLGLGTSAG